MNVETTKGEMIVEIGAEGGSVALYRKQTDQGWCFTMELDDCTPIFDDEGEKPIYKMSAPVVAWDGALELLDRYQWHKLYPVFVHPDFKQQIWDAVKQRLPKNLSEREQSSQQNWQQICDQKLISARVRSVKLERHMASASSEYKKGLQRTFSEYRSIRFQGQDEWFDPPSIGGAVVFNNDHLEKNLIIPPCSPMERERIGGKIPAAKRHRHFGSMLSSQALAQSVFGTLEALNLIPKLSTIMAEDGLPAFGPALDQTKLYFEKEILTLGERPPRTTSIDVWFEGAYRVAVECKFAELEFGNCSRPSLEPENEAYCDGNYIRQKKRTERCALTEIKIGYWHYIPELFRWSSETDQSCPLNKTYQLVRTVLAACVDEGGKTHIDRGHALLIYDERNPAMADDGLCDLAWCAVHSALKKPSTLRRISWQNFIAQWPNEEKLNWLKAEMGAKYGIV